MFLKENKKYQSFRNERCETYHFQNTEVKHAKRPTQKKKNR
jgi:hypothetical protein